MPAQDTDRNLLFAILALQNNFINRETLLSAFAAWVVDKQRPLGEILCEEGKLTQLQDELLRALTQQHVKQHGNDPEQSLAAVSPVGSIRDELWKLGDPQLEASLAVVAQNAPVADSNSTAMVTTCDWGGPGQRFRVLRPHAKGGLGEVFVAQDLELHREVALKEIQARFADQPESRSRFVLEAEITGGLEHPGIVPVYGLGQYADGRPFYAMRFIRGDSLKEAIAFFHKADIPGRDPGERTLELRKLLGRFIDVCEAIEFAHSRGILHRDLKPGNVMLGKYGETLVVDWGLAKAVGRGERTSDTGETTLRPTSGDSVDPTIVGKAVGTPAYMSPEQAGGRLDELGPASDVYSLGATLYCLLAGQPPFSGNDQGEILRRLQRGEFPPPREVKAQVSLPLQAICLRAMALQPADRYRSPQMLADDIEHWLADEPVASYPEPPRVRLRRWVKRHPTLVAGTIATVFLSLVSLAAIASVVGQSNRSLAAKNTELEQANLREREANQLAEQNARTAQENATKAEQSADAALRQTKLAEGHLYVAHMNLAQAAWEDTRVGETFRLLDLCQTAAGQADGPDDLRGFEWYYWNRLAHADQFTLKGHTAALRSVAFSADGKRLASASDDQTVKVWDATNGKETFTLKGHTCQVNSVAFSADGTRLASASGNPWDPSKPGEVKVWDATGGQETLMFSKHTSGITSVAFSPDGKRLASASYDKTVKVWDAASGQEGLTLKGHLWEVQCVTFSPDGKRLASASRDRTVKVWDAMSGQEQLTLQGHTTTVNSAAFSPDGTRLASASMDQTVKVWDATTGQEQLTLKGHTWDVLSVAFSADGKRLASASRDQTVKLWDPMSGQELLTLKGHIDRVTSVAWSVDGIQLASASYDQTVKLWDITSDQTTLPLPGNPVNSVAFSSDGKRLAWGTGIPSIPPVPSEIMIWDLLNGQAPLTLKGHTDSVIGVAVSADGKRLASASADQTVKVWDATSGQEMLTLKGHSSYVTSVAFSPDGERLVSASSDQTVKVWDLTSGQEMLTLKGHTGPVNEIAFSPDGKRLASASNDDTVKVWDIASGQEKATLKGHAGDVYGVAFSPEGKRLASASVDGTAKVWDATSGQELLTLKGHTAEVASVAFSPDGRRLASASLDKTVKLWDATSGRATLTLKGHTDGIMSVAFSPDGHRLASASWDGTVKVWDATPRGLEVVTQRR